MATIPPADLELSAALVSELVAEQSPEFAGRPVVPFAHGWDNEIFQLGDAHLVRLPRRELGVQLLRHEQQWLPRLAPRLPAPVPVPVFQGSPGPRFPRPWSIVPRLPGTLAADVPPARRRASAEPLADFFAALHRPADPGAPHNQFRGVGLAERAEGWLPRIAACFGPAALRRWQKWSSVPPHPGPSLWLHGDPHPLNLLLDSDGGLAGVLDWGDLCGGDPASDLATAWLTFDATGRARFIQRYRDRGHGDELVWSRARAWALGLAAIFVHYSDDAPALGEIGRHAADELLGE